MVDTCVDEPAHVGSDLVGRARARGLESPQHVERGVVVQLEVLGEAALGLGRLADDTWTLVEADAVLEADSDT